MRRRGRPKRSCKPKTFPGGIIARGKRRRKKRKRYGRRRRS